MTELLPGFYSVSLPEEATNIEDTKADGIMWKMPDGSYDSFYFENEDIQAYQIIGTVTKDTIDFDCDQLVNHLKLDFGVPCGEMYQYIKDGFARLTYSSEEYFRSLLTSKGLHFVNPYGEKEPVPEDFEDYHYGRAWFKSWKEAEQNLVKKLVIIKK